MERIPILRMGPYLLVTIQIELDDRIVGQLQEDLMAEIVRRRARGVLVDISGLDLVDSFMGSSLASMAQTARLLGAETVVVGMRPAVAITLVELGVSLQGVRTALDVERGMSELQESTTGGSRAQRTS